MFIDQIQVKSNMFITAYERGKRVPSMCRESHNIWVNLGREFLPRVISPASISPVVSGPVSAYWVQYFAFGIGGNKQTVDIAGFYPALDLGYPGGTTYDKATHETLYLERPVMVTGTPDNPPSHTSIGMWGKQLDLIPPAFPPQLNEVSSVVEFQVTLLQTDIHLGGAYPAVPISEVGMILSSQAMSQATGAIYDYSTPPYIGVASRQRIVAYNNFAPITKTSTISFEFRWQLFF